jgi:hypothetical protein
VETGPLIGRGNIRGGQAERGRAGGVRSQPSGPTTESVPDGASSTTVRATSAADGRARAADSGVAAAAAAAAAATRTPRLAAEPARRNGSGVLEKRVAGEGSGEERREGGADADDIMEIGG